MTDDRHTLELAGCTPIPLVNYLKALGVLRLVSEQVDPDACGWWENDTFRLRSKLDHEGLVEFFLKRYKPTPIVAPWNGGSGFYPKDKQEALLAILNGETDRFGSFREIINVCQQVLDSMSMTAKPDSDSKAELLLRCRNIFPDAVLRWLDAAFVLTREGPKYPPLLGTGGNDGRLEFTNNYMQRLCELINPDNGEPIDDHGESLLESLFGTVARQRCKSPIGQFDPGGAGGANATSGYDAASSINTWDYILMLEGALAFASATVKRLELADPGSLAYPFCVQSAGIGYGSADQTDEAASRNEMWLPLWDTRANFDEVASLFSEGRVEIRGRRARNGVDFARAIASLGIDRGIEAFQRYGFLQRNGLAYFAVPLGRFAVCGDALIEELLAPITNWLDRFRRTALFKNAPSRAGRALRRLETAIFELCQRGNSRQAQNVLIALGQAEAAVAISPALRDPKTGISPVPPLSANWLIEANDDSIEFRLAAALASIGYDAGDKIGPLRRHIEPLDLNTLHSRWPKWNASADDPGLVWGGGGLVRNMIRVLNRRMIEAVLEGKQQVDEKLLFPGKGRYNASLGDIAAFIKGEVDDERIELLLRGLMLIDWRYGGRSILKKLPGERVPIPAAAYAMLKLCHLPHEINGTAIPLTPAITRRAAAGQIAAATRLAARRLRASGLPPAIEVAHSHGHNALRTAAALLFPIKYGEQLEKTSVGRLMRLVLPLNPEKDSEINTDHIVNEASTTT